MSQKDEALKAAGKFLLKLYYHATTPEVARACKTHADLCFLVLPNKYRLTREEHDSLKPKEAADGD